MQSGANTVLQFTLPFGGMQDRIRAAAEAGSVLMLSAARGAMRQLDVSDILIVRAFKRCQLNGEALQGDLKGEWRCSVYLDVKGFRDVGRASITFSEGRIFVEDIRWDHTP
jgi:hypothetical protein